MSLSTQLRNDRKVVVWHVENLSAGDISLRRVANAQNENDENRGGGSHDLQYIDFGNWKIISIEFRRCQTSVRQMTASQKFINSNLNAHLLTLGRLLGKKIGLHHPLVGVTNPKYKLLHLLTTNYVFAREEGTSF